MRQRRARADGDVELGGLSRAADGADRRDASPLSIPDCLNPRYSYAAGKIDQRGDGASTTAAHFERVTIVRPHNVYGPDMGEEHVIPQFVARHEGAAGAPDRSDPVHDSGHRPADALVRVRRRLHRRRDASCSSAASTWASITSARSKRSRSRTLARMVAEHFGRPIEIVPGPPADGGTNRRCPDITKMMRLGYRPRHSAARGAARRGALVRPSISRSLRTAHGLTMDRSRMTQELPRAAGTGGSVVVDRCQVCGSTDLESVLFLGYLPPVNQMRADRRSGRTSSRRTRRSCCAAGTASWCSSA